MILNIKGKYMGLKVGMTIDTGILLQDTFWLSKYLKSHLKIKTLNLI